MRKLNPKKLHVEFRDNVTKTEPILGRKYTLTHSDTTGELFLTVGMNYAYNKITLTRDEVLVTFKKTNNGYMLLGNVCIDGVYPSIYKSNYRRNIFMKELPLALESIIYGDKEFFKAHKDLYNSPIYIIFNSMYPWINNTYYFGTPKLYK
ncbi:hypothetical protein FDF74_04205 [Clostridium niameyense]|uniref:Staygreen protein domain-containing protein n=1 Tax=Clostridium niameyense TaxID=1622073 RepID=A0A6M0R871_9CLOT|nr:staygreen family protein [Clostridium niameyense]NEZ46416.1 hypothetical protein [Clostridium niameyense]